MTDTVADKEVSAKAPPRHRRPAEVVGTLPAGGERVLTTSALLFIADLERRFGPQRRILLENRKLAQMRFDDGELPDFLPETAHIRNSVWEVAPVPKALRENPRGTRYEGRLFGINESYLQVFAPEVAFSRGTELQAGFQIDTNQFTFECVVVRQDENLVFINRPSVIRKSKLREGPRVSMDMRIHYTIWSESGRFEADLRNISESGLRIVGRDRLKQDQVVSLDIYFRDAKFRVICQGQVAWCKPTEDNPYLFETGIQFTTISTETRSNLSLYLAEIVATPEYADA